jgi:hypothetical protein
VRITARKSFIELAPVFLKTAFLKRFNKEAKTENARFVLAEKRKTWRTYINEDDLAFKRRPDVRQNDIQMNNTPKRDIWKMMCRLLHDSLKRDIQQNEILKKGIWKNDKQMNDTLKRDICKMMCR